MNKYKEEFIPWDVSNEMLHFDFYEQRLDPNATLHFYEIAHMSDPLATLFMNEFNVVETCSDVNSTIDTYISRMREVERGGVSMDWIGLEGYLLRRSIERRLSHPNGCYQMCLTDNNFQNLAAGDVVDKLLKEWKLGRYKVRQTSMVLIAFMAF
ncbi:hypothetical protein CFP56_037427 [Quercus suber]|uniref:GH10 domain-containing protein n=1 Tax=Quercus suber TaxID=58331 RepID=A0AAW0LRA4_QUESU